MAITVDWTARVISVPRNDMLLLQSVPTEIRQLDLNSFRLTLRDLEAGSEGMLFPPTHNHNTTVTVAGATLARVVEIINDYTITFEDGQYAVNLVNANSNVAERTNRNQVSLNSANSAGLQDLNSLQAASFGGAVAVDILSSFTGIEFPVGTRDRPANNIADAILIAESRNLRRLEILSSMSISGGDLSDGYVLHGENPISVVVDIDSAADITGCEFTNMTISGVMDGFNVFRECIINDINYVNGFIYKCALNGTITLGGNAQLTLLDCFSNVAGGGPGQLAAVNMGGSGANSLAVRNYSGGLDLSNWTGLGSCSVDMASGRVIVDSTVTGGSITIRGIADVVDNSTGTAVVNDLTINNSIDNVGGGVLTQQDKDDIASRVWEGDLADHTTPGTFGEYVQNKLLTVVRYLGISD